MKSLWIASLLLVLTGPGLAADEKRSGPQSRAGHLGSEGTQDQKGRAAIGGGQSRHLIGAPVQSRNSQQIGTVEAVCLDQGEVVQLIVALGPEAGADNRRVALDYKDVQVRTERDPMVKTGLNPEALREMPDYQYRGDAKPGRVFGDSSTLLGSDQATGSCRD